MPFTKFVHKKISYSVNPQVQMLMKLTLGVNFSNILRAAFTYANPRSAKKTVNLTIFFVLLGSMCVKAANRRLMKLTQGDEKESER